MNENDFLISLFIDDELDLDEKRAFVERVHESAGFKDDALSLLEQEKLLRTRETDPKPLVKPVPARTSRFPIPRSARLAAAALAVAVFVFSAFFFLPHENRVQTAASTPYRFVIYEPGARQVEITGSFTGWRKVSLEKRGAGGYWEITLPLAPGEHSFTYILDGTRKVADPTLPASETDDFGGENSILYTGDAA